jgi:hypothetical protein
MAHKEVEICRIERLLEEGNPDAKEVYRIIGVYRERKIIIAGRPQLPQTVPDEIRVETAYKDADGDERWKLVEEGVREKLFDGFAMLLAQNKVEMAVRIQTVAQIIESAINNLAGQDACRYFEQIAPLLGIGISYQVTDMEQLSGQRPL